jgi:eukaryotic-like serine/threonine-protein kinase
MDYQARSGAREGLDIPSSSLRIKMTSERNDRAREIFAAVLKREPGTREILLKSACGDDAELRKRVEDLLAGHERILRAATAPAQLLPGEKLGGRFVIVQFLASGGMGEVYEVIDEHLQGKHFALKILRAGIAGDANMRQRFEREVILACEVRHPNVCPTQDLLRLEGPRGPLLCLTMKLLRGESLAARLGRAGRMPPDAALPIIRQMAAGLDAAHAAGVIHRDFKPGNIMIEYRGEQPHVWITDFGFSRDYHSDQTISALGQIPGTPGYVAPELFAGRSSSPASDVYAFGVVVYEMITGRRPPESPGGTIAAPSSFAPDIPPVWDRMVLGCLPPDPSKRFASAGEALAFLDATPRTLPGLAQRNYRQRLHRIVVVVAALTAAIFGLSRIPPIGSRLAGVFARENRAGNWMEVGKEALRHRDRKGSIGNAIAAFQAAVAADGQNAAAWAVLAQAYLYQNQLSPDTVTLNQANYAANRAVKANPYLAAAHVAKGSAELAAGRPETALAEIGRALELDPRDAGAVMALGDVYARQQKDREAEQAYRKAMGLSQNDWYAKARFGMFLQARGRYPEAAAWYEQARQSDPDNAVVNRNLGAAYFAMENFDAAASAFQRALATDPSAIVYTDLGTLFFYQGRYEEAVDAFERAVHMDSNRFRVWANLADAYRWTPGKKEKAAGAYAEAIRLIRQAIEKAPADINLTSQLATFLAKVGRTREALAEIANVRSGQPSPVLVRAATVEELCGDRPKALAWLRQAIEAGYSIKELNNEPEFTGLRKTPEYHRLAAAAIRAK